VATRLAPADHAQPASDAGCSRGTSEQGSRALVRRRVVDCAARLQGAHTLNAGSIFSAATNDCLSAGAGASACVAREPTHAPPATTALLIVQGACGGNRAERMVKRDPGVRTKSGGDDEKRIRLHLGCLRQCGGMSSMLRGGIRRGTVLALPRAGAPRSQPRTRHGERTSDESGRRPILSTAQVDSDDNERP